MIANQLPFPAPIDKDYVPKCSITQLPADAPIQDILDVIDRDGGIILTDMVSVDQLATIKKDLEPYGKKTETQAVKHGIKLIPSETHLIYGLVGKSKTVAQLCEHPTLVALQDSMLTERFDSIREDEFTTHTIDPLLNISVSFNIGYGAPRQRIHRDDQIHHIDHSIPFELSKASEFGCLIAGCDTTRENGATMFIPGSHRWDDVRKASPDEVCFAEMKAGSALIFLGSSYHGGGHNSVPGFVREVHGLFFIRGIYRQEENQFLAIPQNIVMGMSNKMLSLLGYKKPTTTLGIVEDMDPASDLKGVFQRITA